MEVSKGKRVWQRLDLVKPKVRLNESVLGKGGSVTFRDINPKKPFTSSSVSAVQNYLKENGAYSPYFSKH